MVLPPSETGVQISSLGLMTFAPNTRRPRDRRGKRAFHPVDHLRLQHLLGVSDGGIRAAQHHRVARALRQIVRNVDVEAQLVRKAHTARAVDAVVDLEFDARQHQLRFHERRHHDPRLAVRDVLLLQRLLGRGDRFQNVRRRHGDGAARFARLVVKAEHIFVHGQPEVVGGAFGLRVLQADAAAQLLKVLDHKRKDHVLIDGQHDARVADVLVVERALVIVDPSGSDAR